VGTGVGGNSNAHAARKNVSVMRTNAFLMVAPSLL
jgi:hypothetical protein